MGDIGNAVLNLAEKHMMPFRVKNGQVVVEYCPFCGGHNVDKETFAVGLSNGAWNCKRGSCGKTGNFRQLCEFFGEQAPVDLKLPAMTEQQKKTYVRPSEDIVKPITEEIITYFATRRISEETLTDWGIGADEKGNIIFPFYRDNKLVYVKYRKPKKHVKEDGPKEWQMPDTEPILFGMDMTNYNRPLVITEGEIDALALYEAGVSNVVSVPSGCNNLEWVNLCWEYLENFNQIILFGDTDEPGLEMVSTLSKRLGEDRCMVPKEYPEFIWNGKDMNRICKDANEILIAWGPEFLKKMVDSCEPAPIKGVLELSKIPFIDPTTVPRLLSRIPMLDNMIGGFGEGSLCIISGKRGEGRQICSRKTW